MDLTGIIDPLPSRAEAVPGVGIVTWSDEGERRIYAEGLAVLHQPARIRVIFTWPLPHLVRSCGRCAGPWPCNRYAWAHQALAGGQDCR